MTRDLVREDQVRTLAVGRGVLVRYQVMAFTTAALLIVLVFVGIPLQLVAGRPGVANVVGTMHGFLYLIYLYVAFALTRKLAIPKWQMVLVLLAGTVPFCAFVAERKMTRRFENLGGGRDDSPGKRAGRSLTAYASGMGRRWLSRRAILLHLEVAIVATGCVAAGWWQATRALAGNGLSWFYSVEWPAFALVALVGWWYLIHEDPEVLKARKQPKTSGGEVTAGDGTAPRATTLEGARETTVEDGTARLAKSLAILVGVELLLGIVALLFVPVGRPSGLLPAKGAAIYLAHGIVGVPLGFGAVALLVRVRGSARLSQLSGRVGAIGLAMAGAGGLLTVAHPSRLAGMALMLIGTVIAGSGYLIPTFEKLS